MYSPRARRKKPQVTPDPLDGRTTPEPIPPTTITAMKQPPTQQQVEANGASGFMFSSPQKAKTQQRTESTSSSGTGSGLGTSTPKPTKVRRNLSQALSAVKIGSPRKSSGKKTLSEAKPRRGAKTPAKSLLALYPSTTNSGAPGTNQTPTAAVSAPVEAGNELFSPSKSRHSYFLRSRRNRLQQESVSITEERPPSNGDAMDVDDVPATSSPYESTAGVLNAHQQETMVTELKVDLDLNDMHTEEQRESFLLIHQIQQMRANEVKILQFTSHSSIPAVQQPGHFDGVFQHQQHSVDPSKMTLVLDLDETLVHCSTDRETIDRYDLEFTVRFQNRDFNVYVQKRPGVMDFLERVNRWYNVIIFTASQQIYADKLLDLLDPERKLTGSRKFRDSCLQIQGTFVKDLEKVHHDLNEVIIVDNALEAFALHLDNGVPIKSWYSDPKDNELQKLGEFLERLAMAHQYHRQIQEPWNVRDRLKQFGVVERFQTVVGDWTQQYQQADMDNMIFSFQ